MKPIVFMHLGNRMGALTASAFLFLTSISCASSSFSGASKAGSNPRKPQILSTGTATSVCGDKVSVKWEGKAKECIVDHKKMFNFATGECTMLNPAPYECNWQVLNQQLTAAGFNVEQEFNNRRAEGSRLVACGLSSDSLITVFQWFKMPDGEPKDCSYDMTQVQIKTECYEIDIGTEPLKLPQTEEERMQKVSECLKKVQG